MSRPPATDWSQVFAWMDETGHGPREAARQFDLRPGTVMSAVARRKAAPPVGAAAAAAVFVALAKLTPWAANPRKNDKAVPAVADSIVRFGFGAPIVARSSGEIIAGHTRLKAALGLPKRWESATAKQRAVWHKDAVALATSAEPAAPVRYLDLSEDEAHALALADNRVGEIAQWDDVALHDALSSLQKAGAAVTGLGWGQADLAGILGAAAANNTPDPGPSSLPVIPDSVVGAVYELGPHRLVCGDSTKSETWTSVLLPGERIQCVWTDPPYGVSYVGGTKAKLTILNDELTGDDLGMFLRAAFEAMLGACEPGAAWYVAAPAGTRGMQFAYELHRLGLYRQRCVWVKDRFVLGHSDFHFRHEDVYFAQPGEDEAVLEDGRVLRYIERNEDVYFGYTPGTDGRRGRGGEGWFGGHARDTVFEIPRPAANRDHPTMKPIELIKPCLESSSLAGWLVGEAFGGSGSTLIACAQTGRIARVIELDPKYCDVIRRRWTRWARAAGVEVGPGGLDG